jgi:diphthamide biosynthesis enzyme Dph1/Dph2-like protein
MKFEFIEARYTGKYNLEHVDYSILNETIFLGSAIQFLNILPEVKQKLEKMGKTVILLTGNHSSHPGQILGCDISNINNVFLDNSKGNKNNNETIYFSTKSHSILIISTGEFHGISGALNNECSFTLNPITGKISKISSKKSIGMFTKFLSSDRIGILITTKPGQHDERMIDELIKLYPQKEFYKIIMDHVDSQRLIDFNFIQFFVNTACPRMIDDRDSFSKGIINIDLVIQFSKMQNK